MDDNKNEREERGITENNKEITINIEAKGEKELFRLLVKAKYLLEEHFQDERRRGEQDVFRNFDICSQKVQVIIRDKKGMFNNAELTIYDVKEISKKDLKIIRKCANSLEKKGFAITTLPARK